MTFSMAPMHSRVDGKSMKNKCYQKEGVTLRHGYIRSKVMCHSRHICTTHSKRPLTIHYPRLHSNAIGSFTPSLMSRKFNRLPPACYPNNHLYVETNLSMNIWEEYYFISIEYEKT